MPETESPSASQMGVHHIIDHMVGNVYDAEQQKEYRNGSDALSSHLEGVDDLSTSLQLLENDSSQDPSDLKKGYMALKQQSIAYYLSI